MTQSYYYVYSRITQFYYYGLYDTTKPMERLYKTTKPCKLAQWADTTVTGKLGAMSKLHQIKRRLNFLGLGSIHDDGVIYIVDRGQKVDRGHEDG